MHYNDVASVMDVVAFKSEKEENNVQLNRLISLLAKKSLIKKPNPSVLLEWSDPAIINIPDGRYNASANDMGIDFIKNKQHRSKGLKRGEWQGAKKRQVRIDMEAAKDERAMRLTKRRNVYNYDIDWEEYFPGN